MNVDRIWSGYGETGLYDIFFYETVETLIFSKIIIGFFSSFINIKEKKINFTL